MFPIQISISAVTSSFTFLPENFSPGVISKDFVLPTTTIEAFVQFLNGEHEDTYGDKGSIVLDVLKHTIQLAIYDTIGRGVKGLALDVYRFLQRVFPMFSTRIHTELVPEFGPLDNARFEAIREACIDWTNDFASVQLQQNNGTVSLVQTSQV